METSDPAVRRLRGAKHTPRPIGRGQRGVGALTDGGTDGNERLTAVTGLVLIALLAVIGLTIVQMRPLISVHLFVGLLLIGPVVLKMASTGYRFMRYYTGNARYREKGPPEILLRLTAPLVVLSTIVVLVSGVILLFEGRAHRDPMLLIHKVSFIVWVVFTAIHVLGHLPEVIPYLPGLGDGSGARQLRDSIPGLVPTTEHDWSPTGSARSLPGGRGRALALIGALVAGLVLALALIPDFSAWT
jgi:hypothetical protein